MSDTPSDDVDADAAEVDSGQEALEAIAIMSDEDFINGFDSMDTPTEPEDKSDVDSEAEEPHEGDEIPTPAPEVGDKAPGTETGESAEAAEQDGNADDEEQDTGKDTPSADVNADEAIDYEKKYNSFLAEIEADGHKVSLKSRDDLVSLVKTSVANQRIVAQSGPAIHTKAMLDKAGIKSIEDISYLIDLSNGNPDAVAKLLKDKNIDPLTMEEGLGDTYKPNDHSVSNGELELKQVIDELSGSKNFDTLMERNWDTKSNDEFTRNPILLKTLTSHVASGIYQKISGAVGQQRLFGQLVGLSDLEAYKAVGDAMNKDGLLAIAPDTKKPDVIKPTKGKKSAEPVDSNRRRAASTPKGGAGQPKAIATMANISKMSDEDFMKSLD